MGEEQAGEVGVHAFITADQLVGEGQARHESTLLQPEDGRERAREEDALNGSKGNETFSKRGLLVGDPSESPVGLLLDARDGLDCIEKVLSLLGVLDVSVDEQGVCLGVDVLHHNLEAIEAASLGCLNLVGETLDKVLVDDTVGGSEEGEDM